MKNVQFALFAALLSVILCSCGSVAPAPAHDAEDPHAGHNHGDQVEHGDEIIFTPEQALAAGLQTQIVEQAPFERVIKTSGQIAAAAGDMATVAATSSGLVSFENRSLSEGTAVKKGETLATISSTNIAGGDVVAKSRAAYVMAEKAYERGKKLAADNIISGKDLDQLRLDLESAKISFDALGGSLDGNGGVRVAAPISGYVQSRLVNEGQYVALGEPIATIVQNRRVQLRAEVSQKHFGELSSIASANFRTAYDDRLYKTGDMNGRILSFGKAAGENSFYIPVVFEMDNVGSIVGGAFVEVFLLSKPMEGVMSVPRAAIVEQQGLHYVFVQIDDEGFLKREVTLGADNGERIEIIKGLHAGDKVVTKGATQVRLAATSSVIPEGHTH